jgi:hypothetical protein
VPPSSASFDRNHGMFFFSFPFSLRSLWSACLILLVLGCWSNEKPCFFVFSPLSQRRLLEVLCIAAYVSLKFQAFLWRDCCLWVRFPSFQPAV